MTMGWGGIFGRPEDSTVPLPSSIEARYQRDPRRQTLAQIMAQPARPAYSPGEAIVQALTKGIAGYQANQLEKDYQKRGEDYRNKMAQALTAGRGGVDEFGSVIPGDSNRMISLLAGIDPDMAFKAQQDELRRAAEQATWEKRFGMEKTARREDMGLQNDYQNARDELSRAHQAAQQDKSIAAQQALQAAQQKFTAAEAALQRQFMTGQQERQQTFTAGEAEKSRAATMKAQEAARNAPTELIPDPYGEGRMIPRAQAEAAATAQGNYPTQAALAAARSPQAASAQQKIDDAKDVLGILDMAEPLIDKSTGSTVGSGIDWLAKGVGISTGGAEAAAQLKALQGILVSKMPKMSGPQSDKDVLLYREMAGQIGDPTIPAAQKKAAIKVIRQLNQRYAGQQAGTGQQAAPSPPAAPKPSGRPSLPEGFVELP